MNIVRSLLSGVARSRALPDSVRETFARYIRSGWGFLPKPIVVDTPVGRMALDPREYIDLRLFLFNSWEPTLSTLMSEQLRPGDAAIDIGANIGYFTLLASKAVGSGGRVHAVEPGPESLARLRRNLHLNNLEKTVTVIPYGISDRTERRAFTKFMARNLGANSFGEAIDEGGLELRPLRDLIPPEELSRVTFIKVDVEGMEELVLPQIVELLPSLSPRLTIAAELRSSPEIDRILDQFTRAGFAMYLLENKYTVSSYAEGKFPRPVAITELPTGQHDVALISKAAR